MPMGNSTEGLAEPSSNTAGTKYNMVFVVVVLVDGGRMVRVCVAIFVSLSGVFRLGDCEPKFLPPCVCVAACRLPLAIACLPHRA
eukprot:scaffold20114_cov178-Skeletonema_marinoi.AAC.1